MSVEKTLGMVRSYVAAELDLVASTKLSQNRVHSSPGHAAYPGMTIYPARQTERNTPSVYGWPAELRKGGDCELWIFKHFKKTEDADEFESLDGKFRWIEKFQGTAALFSRRQVSN
jgi:hypothetical protein